MRKACFSCMCISVRVFYRYNCNKSFISASRPTDRQELYFRSKLHGSSSQLTDQQPREHTSDLPAHKKKRNKPLRTTTNFSYCDIFVSLWIFTVFTFLWIRCSFAPCKICFLCCRPGLALRCVTLRFCLVLIFFGTRAPPKANELFILRFVLGNLCGIINSTLKSEGIQ